MRGSLQMPKVSIIALVYNLEEYTPLCIESVLDQSFKDFELILVNDGSTDSSGRICDEYAEIDSRIKVVNKSNAGIVAARNTGIEHSTGEYIAYIDCVCFIYVCLIVVFCCYLLLSIIDFT